MMQIIDTDEYSFCNVCHLMGMEHAVEVKLTLIEETPRVTICKQCAESLAALAQEIKE